METKLHKYLQTMSLKERGALALRARAAGLRCSGGHITNVARNTRNASQALVKFIVSDSAGKLKQRHGMEYLYGVEA